jgi:hypothetical protein|tara:strand:- start:34 stop:399 length:366 start_codon:yes stop_codon:yes gene_type:complete
MKKSLLLAALLLSSAAQAETWVCSTPTTYGGSILLTLVRQGEVFSYTLTTPATQEEESRTVQRDPYEILVETDAMLTLVDKAPNGRSVSITTINKITKQSINQSVDFGVDLGKSEGSCIGI